MKKIESTAKKDTRLITRAPLICRWFALECSEGSVYVCLPRDLIGNEAPSITVSVEWNESSPDLEGE